MNYFEAIVLGIVQGITEFLPVSSSGHLILVPYLLGWEIQDLSFDVGLHVGTALAVLIYFRSDWVLMIRSFFKDLSVSHKYPGNFGLCVLRRESRLFLYIIVATIPVGIIGLLLEKPIEEFFRSPLLVSLMLILVSAVMYFAHLYNKRNQGQKDAESFIDVLLVSLSQALALIPGTSRSGITISSGLFRGFSRENAARISFLLATPIIIAAAIFQLPDAFSSGDIDAGLMLTGLLTSFVVGYVCIKWFLAFLKKYSLVPFIIYRLLLALLIILTVLAK